MPGPMVHSIERGGCYSFHNLGHKVCSNYFPIKWPASLGYLAIQALSAGLKDPEDLVFEGAFRFLTVPFAFVKRP